MNGNCSMTAQAETLSDKEQLEFQWENIDWKKAENEVNRLQVRIAKATQEKKWNTVKRFQYLLTHSYYADLSLLLYDIAEGSDSFIWNGHTTITSESQFVCLDTNALQGTSDNVKRTQYFNLLTYCWEQMSRNREERVLLICDEAYLMIDQKVPQSLVYLRNAMKRARKYESALAIPSTSTA